ncbi:MAG: trypsin-like peptidase domain-containing protein [Candidatus Moranbacteria bacterium]|nr:trypsin-like peptidase domain-containing protein [Candidatus Moranbacteria bacterium]
MDDIKKVENFNKEESKGGTAQHVYGRLTMAALVGIVVVTIIISSLFGAIFGFMSAGAVNIFSAQIGQKFHQYFPNVTLHNIDPQVSKQQVIVEDSAIIDVVEKTSPAVVSIVISKNVPNAQNNPGNFFDPFGFDPFGNGPTPQTDGQGSQKQTIGGGSGFFITSDGYILTNRHVVDDAQADYSVMTNDGKEYAAKVLARDPVRDVAVIKIEGNGFPVATLGDSDSLKIGETAVAIGNSLGEFSNSVSRGIISGLKRNLNAGSGFGDTERLTDIIQTDAAINPGNSGGPLLDINGNVIGVNVAVAQGAQNVGFALPINQAKRIIDQVKNGTKISVPYLGVRYIVIDSSVQKDAQLPFDYGVLVLRGSRMTDLAVIPGSPADKAGIGENDIILEINGQKLDQTNQLGDVIAKYNVGDTVTLKIWHKGNINDVQVKLEERKQ